MKIRIANLQLALRKTSQFEYFLAWTSLFCSGVSSRNRSPVRKKLLSQKDWEPSPKVKEFAMFAMKKLLIAGVAGLMVMAVAGSQTAMAAPFRGVYHERFAPRPVYRTAYGAYGHNHFVRGPVYRPYCW